MYIRTEKLTTPFQNKNGVKYDRTKKLYIFTCDECSEEFQRDVSYPSSRLDNNKYKHFCGKCKNRGCLVGVKKRKKLPAGEKWLDKAGYVVVRLQANEDYPGKRTKNFLYVREHIKVMQDSIGRKLHENEVVHHIDGDKTNNQIDNLDLCSIAQHNKCHATSEAVVFELYKKGIVKYDRQEKKYYTV